jgi:hypothetical protein
MPRFKVSIPTLWYRIVEIEAKDKFEAIRTAFDSDFKLLESEFEYARVLGVSIFAPTCSRIDRGLPEPDYTFLAKEIKE